MSGSRCKALRREFFERNGRMPDRARVETETIRQPYTDEQLRKGVRPWNIVRWFGRVLHIKRAVVVQKSEWRQVKRAWLRRARGRHSDG